MQWHNFDLSTRNTFRMKVSCALYVEVTEEKDLADLDWDSLPQPVMVIGGGSNLLFTSEFFPGTVLHVGIAGQAGNDVNITDNDRASCPAPTGHLLVTLPAGTVFDDFCAWAASQELWGPENLSLIPGEVGASAVQNIGAYGVEAKDIIADIRAWDTVERRFVNIDPADCEYGYRTSRFKTAWKGRFIITAVTYRLSRTPRPVLDYGGIRKALEIAGQAGNDANITGNDADVAGNDRASCPAPTGHLSPQLIRDTIIAIRRKKLPAVEEIGSAGSFFCNPVISRAHFQKIVDTAKADNGPDYEVPHYVTPEGIKVPAAWMIEQCGFKGKRLGGAEVYRNQPLVIVNASGSAQADEILDLEHQVIDAISAKYGITLHPEVEHI